MRILSVALLLILAAFRMNGSTVCAQECEAYFFNLPTGAVGAAADAGFATWKPTGLADCEQMRGRIQASLDKGVNAAREADARAGSRTSAAIIGMYDVSKTSAQKQAERDSAAAAADKARTHLLAVQQARSQFPRRCECFGQAPTQEAQSQDRDQRISSAEAREKDATAQAARATTARERERLNEVARQARLEADAARKSPAARIQAIPQLDYAAERRFRAWLQQRQLVDDEMARRQAVKDEEARQAPSALAAYVNPLGTSNSTTAAKLADAKLVDSFAPSSTTSAPPAKSPNTASGRSTAAASPVQPVASRGGSTEVTGSRGADGGSKTTNSVPKSATNSVPKSQPSSGADKATGATTNTPSKAARTPVESTTFALKQSVGKRLSVLTALKKESDATFDDALRSLEQEHRSLTNTANNVDATAQVALVLASVGQMSYKASKSIGANAGELARITAEIRKDLSELTLLVPVPVAPGGNTAQNVWAASIKAWSDVQSPSFWASFLTKWRDDSRAWSDVSLLSDAIDAGSQGPIALLTEAKSRIEAQRLRTNRLLDARIAETKRLIGR